MDDRWFENISCQRSRPLFLAKSLVPMNPLLPHTDFDVDTEQNFDSYSNRRRNLSSFWKFGKLPRIRP